MSESGTAKLVGVTKEFLPGMDLIPYSEKLIAQLIATTKSSIKLPKDVEFNCLTTQPFRDFMKEQQRVANTLLGNTLMKIKPACNWMEANLNHIDEADDEDRLDILIDCVDSALERVDLYLGSAKGLHQNYPLMTESPGEIAIRRKSIMQAKNILRPQVSFGDIDNSTAPFVPKLTRKPHAIVGLEESLKLPSVIPPQSEELVKNPEIDAHVRELGLGFNGDAPQPNHFSSVKTTRVSYPHPYGPELMAWEPPGSQLRACIEKPYAPVADTPLVWVNTPELLQKLSCTLQGSTEFAIDLEAHTFRSYAGFVCLMQVSTHTEDYLIDTLVLRSNMHVLLEPFTNPNIVKVLHGASSDIVWLQRDFGLYIVNMFDTGQAMRVLNFPKFSLAYLLKFYCDVDADKSYQTADWRIRPLTSEMLHYAREDTHYLLYIYARLTNELCAKSNEMNNLIKAVYSKSRDICASVYEKPLCDDESAQDLYNKNNRSLTPMQFQIFKALHLWRDGLAREQDESTGYVLPNHMLFTMAEVAPKESNQIFATCQPTPPLVRVHADALLTIINTIRRQLPVAHKAGTGDPPVVSEPINSQLESVAIPMAEAAPELDLDDTVTKYKIAQLLTTTACLSKIAAAFLLPNVHSSIEDVALAKVKIIRDSFTLESFTASVLTSAFESSTTPGAPAVAQKNAVLEAPPSITEVSSGVSSGPATGLALPEIFRLSRLGNVDSSIGNFDAQPRGSDSDDDSMGLSGVTNSIIEDFTSSSGKKRKNALPASSMPGFDYSSAKASTLSAGSKQSKLSDDHVGYKAGNKRLMRGGFGQRNVAFKIPKVSR